MRLRFNNDRAREGTSIFRDTIANHGSRSSPTDTNISSTRVTSPSFVAFASRVEVSTSPIR